MSHIIKDRIKEITQTAGTGPFALLGASLGALTFASVMANADTCHYCADDGVGNWEVGLGTWNTGNTLTRTTVLASSNSGSLTDFPAGDKALFITNPAASVLAASTIDGIFTPVMAGTTLAGVGTYTTQTGTFKKIGKIVYFNIVLDWSAHTGTGNAKITGLPYAAAETIYVPLIPNLHTLAGSLWTVQIGTGTTEGVILQSGNGSALTAQAIDTAAGVRVSGFYFTA